MFRLWKPCSSSSRQTLKYALGELDILDKLDASGLLWNRLAECNPLSVAPLFATHWSSRLSCLSSFLELRHPWHKCRSCNFISHNFPVPSKCLSPENGQIMNVIHLVSLLLGNRRCNYNSAAFRSNIPKLLYYFRCFSYLHHAHVMLSSCGTLLRCN